VSATWGGGDDAHPDTRSVLLFPGGRRRRDVVTDELAVTLARLARLANDLADQAGLLDVMVAQVAETPAPGVRQSTARAAADLHAAAGALYAVAGRVRP
jgi:hypothetical protein